MQKFTLLLDLKNDPQLIEEYENIHKEIPAYIAKTIKDSGITKVKWIPMIQKWLNGKLEWQDFSN